MNELLAILAGGTLQSDGRADEAADLVARKPRLFAALMAGLSETDDVVRARTAHALERVSRTHPEWLHPLLPELLALAVHDEVPMVRWHIAMIFGNLDLGEADRQRVIATLYRLLEDASTFVKSWAIVALTILGHKHPEIGKSIAARIRRLDNDARISIRSKVGKALRVLEDENEPLPPGWLKTGYLRPMSRRGTPRHLGWQEEV